MLSTEQNTSDIPYWIALAHLPFIMTPARFKKLLPVFGSAENIFYSTEKDLVKNGLSQECARIFINQRQQISLDKIHNEMARAEIFTLHSHDPHYPPLLKQIPDAPYIIFYQGNRQCLHAQSLAVVGSRIPTPYGQATINTLLPQIVQNNITIVSGLARGIDTLAHQIATRTPGKTIAVLGAGLGMPLTHQQRRLKKEIIHNNGIILSELPPKYPPTQFTFPRRNRIIAGLSQGVLVIEATRKSGSLITTRYAKHYQRKIYAVPGNIFYEKSTGTHQLIQNGAKLVTCSEDILADFFPGKINPPITPNLLSEEIPLYNAILQSPMNIDELSQKINLPQQQINATLIKMELTGKIIQMSNGEYRVNCDT